MVKLSGDSHLDGRRIFSANIIISSAENWDRISRRWRNRNALQNINLLIVDAMHLIGSNEGPLIEICVSRMQYISTQTGSPIRIIGLSTSVANAQDLGE